MKKKKTKTFAQRAKAIQKRYPYADRISADKEARDSELMNLFAEQEQYKAENGIEAPNQQFANAGMSYGIPFDLLPEANTIPTVTMPGTYNKPNLSPIGDLENYVAGKEEEEQKKDYSQWSSGMNIAAGAAPAIGNLANMLSMPSTRKVTPQLINPTFSFNSTDLTPYMTALDNDMASNRYNLMQSGADFDTVSAGLNKLGSTYAQGRGQITLEQSRMNQQEAARGDSIMNRGAELNTAAENSARFRYEDNRRHDEQVKRDYLAGFSENISAIFQDEADRYLGLELGPKMGNVEALQNILKWS